MKVFPVSPVEEVAIDNNKKDESKINILEKFIPDNQPYFILSEDKTINIPINIMDCNRIVDKLK